MTYQYLRCTIELHSPFGTPLAGDTLFGHLCWAAKEHLGEAALNELLVGYTGGQPWVVVSDGFPTGYLPKPTVPQSVARGAGSSDHKADKALRWVPLDKAGAALAEMLASAQSDEVAYRGKRPVETVQAHNTLNRLSGSTGKGEFAPYVQTVTFHGGGQHFDIYLVYDEARITRESLLNLLKSVGAHGYGKDASTGLGKFTLESCESVLTVDVSATTVMTLAPAALQGISIDPARSYWRVISRFGRHGSTHALASNPFKNPVLLAATGALLHGVDNQGSGFIGQGLGGAGRLSKAQPGTVHQGYAPVVPVGRNLNP